MDGGLETDSKTTDILLRGASHHSELSLSRGGTLTASQTPVNTRPLDRVYEEIENAGAKQ